MPVIVYTYDKCSTCRKALQWLDARGIDYVVRPIRETPPTAVEIRKMVGVYDGEIRRVFNTSGMDYRAMELKDKVGAMPLPEAIDLLRSNGMLVKWPFLLTETGAAAGFREKAWAALLA